MNVSDKIKRLQELGDLGNYGVPVEIRMYLNEYADKLEAEAKAEPTLVVTENFDGYASLKWLKKPDSASSGRIELYTHPPKTSADAGQAPVVSELFINTIAVDIEQAMLRAFNFGQTYWQQADSESIRQQTKSDETKKKFDEVVLNVKSEICSSIAKLGQSVPDERRPSGFDDCYGADALYNAGWNDCRAAMLKGEK